MRELRAAGDEVGLLFTLNEGTHGNAGGMGRSALHEIAKFSTKKLIVDYVNELTQNLKHKSLTSRARNCAGEQARFLRTRQSLFCSFVPRF